MDLEDQLNYGGKYDTNYIIKDIEPESKGYRDEEDPMRIYWNYSVEEGVFCEKTWTYDEG